MSARRRFALGVLLVDAPALVAVAALGSVYGYVHVYEAVSAWRLAHPASFAPSLVLLCLFAKRRRRADCKLHTATFRPSGPTEQANA